MANIIEKIAAIRQAVFGKDVRESIAKGIEAINSEVENNTVRQNVIDSQEQSRIDAENIRKSNETNRQNSESTRQTIFEINESDRQDTFESNENARQTNETYRETVFAAMEHAEPTIEMVEARGTYPTLKEHFVAIETDIEQNTAQLSDIQNQLGTVPIDGGTFFENYTDWENDGGTF